MVSIIAFLTFVIPFIVQSAAYILTVSLLRGKIVHRPKIVQAMTSIALDGEAPVLKL